MISLSHWGMFQEGRQAAGIAEAKAKGKYKGRPVSISAAQVVGLKVQGFGPSQIARKLGIGRASVYRALGRNLECCQIWEAQKQELMARLVAPPRIGVDMPEFKQYRRTQIAEMRPWSPDVDMTRVSVSASDREAGSPKAGDMIARNPKSHADQWLVAAQYFADNFEPLHSPPETDADDLQAQLGQAAKD